MGWPGEHRLAGVEDIQPLVQKGWPLLKSLNLCNVVDDTLGIEELLRIHSCWPLLNTLYLTKTSHALACWL